jgi:hypothetical protein
MIKWSVKLIYRDDIWLRSIQMIPYLNLLVSFHNFLFHFSIINLAGSQLEMAVQWYNIQTITSTWSIAWLMKSCKLCKRGFVMLLPNRKWCNFYFGSGELMCLVNICRLESFHITLWPLKRLIRAGLHTLYANFRYCGSSDIQFCIMQDDLFPCMCEYEQNICILHSKPRYSAWPFGPYVIQFDHLDLKEDTMFSRRILSPFWHTLLLLIGSWYLFEIIW